MEKEGYRENLAMLTGLFPGKVTITPKEAAGVMSASDDVVYDAIKRKRNPLPAQRLSTKKIVIPIAGFARWLS